ncbi:non-homologous end-joining DNA ligase [Haloplasma contractile]|uniref:DNA ligase (ATP) n=1 Tax=Haloplasma contractile SSD-17B TaxID=1033810 RepID=F7Q1G3_9MOLU|nr:non-homologous end-joining DNA ligase [Haloplasma contractile]ERJ12882.1 DNA ligase protein [Haloplasma contractile SSD-17B]
MGDLFEKREARAMLLTEEEPFDSDDHIFELKLDGIRCLLYLDPKAAMTDLRNKRNKHLNNTYPELSQLHKQALDKCIVDGELIVMDEGKPDFYEVQRRSLMMDSFKIELAAKMKPVIFVAYDLVYLKDEELIHKSLMERKKRLQETIKENEAISISRYIENKGIEFYETVANQDLEGVVAKRKDSIYYMGKRSKAWVKFKKMYDADFVIVGYVPSVLGGIKSLLLAVYDEAGKLVDQGHVSLGISKEDAKKIMKFAYINEMESPFEQDKFNDTEWFKPELVCIVEFMMRTKSGHLRQPVFKGLRQDKLVSECTLEQFN